MTQVCRKTFLQASCSTRQDPADPLSSFLCGISYGQRNLFTCIYYTIFSRRRFKNKKKKRKRKWYSTSETDYFFDIFVKQLAFSLDIVIVSHPELALQD